MAAMNSQEASSSTSPCTYHVFLSFRGEDTRKTFTDHLYTALVQAGFRTFRDDDELERGEDIKCELDRAIRESRIAIVVFSKNYASSSWCLDELVMILKRRASGHVVLPVFYNVDPSEVRKQMGSFEEAFSMHEEKIEAETGERKMELKVKVQKWRAALKEVADLAGINLQNQADRHEARFIQQIIKVVEDKLSRTPLYIAPHPIGIEFRAQFIQLWLEDESSDVGVVAICGMGGIGKTTIAKFLYNLNFLRFEGSSFLANVRMISEQEDGLLRLQRQLLSDILMGRKVKINNVDEGIVKIQDAICCKRVLIVLDDVDKRDQLDVVLGMRNWLFPGSKIIITARNERLLKAHEVFKVHRVERLDCDESLELFSWHSFGQSCPIDGYLEISKRVVNHCGGLPLAIKVLGSSLSGNSLKVWESRIEKLKAIPDSEILQKLKISYDSLQDDHDQNLFLHLACLFVGSHKDWTVTILNGCEFHTEVGIQNLIDRCLLTIDEHNTLVMHQLLRDMGREIVRQESLKESGKRSILWDTNDSLTVLRDNIGTIKIEGLVLDLYWLKEDNSTKIVSGINSRPGLEEYHEKTFSSLGSLLNRYWFSGSPSHIVATAPENSNPIVLEADAFERMCKLKILQLNRVHIRGPYHNFPKRLRWLRWHGFPLMSIPIDFPLEGLVALDMCYSSLKNIWEGVKFLNLLKILNLSHSHNLAKTPNFSGLPNLEWLFLINCSSLVEVHESIEFLERLVLLNLQDCKSLSKLPRSLNLLKSLETLVISGCSSLKELPTDMGDMESLKVLWVDEMNINQLLSTPVEVRGVQSFLRPWLLKPRKSPGIYLPRWLVELSLVRCNLSDDTFPNDLSNLSSLKKLTLDYNPICRIPDSIKRLTSLEELRLEKCTRLRTIEMHHQLQMLYFGFNTLLEKITFPSVSHQPQGFGWGVSTCENLVEWMGMFELEPIGNVDTEIINNLGLSKLVPMGNSNVMLISLCWAKPREFPLQGCHEKRIFNTYLPGSKVPTWFNQRNLGFSIRFTVPSGSNSRVQALSVCSIYKLSSGDQTKFSSQTYSHTVIHNKTKDLFWIYSPFVFGVPEAGEEMMWLSYWKFENQLEAGDEIIVSVFGCEIYVQVKEVGVHLVYKENQEDKSTQLASEEEEQVSQCLKWYGNVVPGNVSAHPANPVRYVLGWDFLGSCPVCKSLRNSPRILWRQSHS